MQMGIFRANPKGRVFPGGLLCQEARQGDRPLASLPFAHPIPESLRRNPVEFFNSLLTQMETVDGQAGSYGRDAGVLAGGGRQVGRAPARARD
ncbi:MAG: hypothetical protein BWY57_01669 [Betaproteobacteria bacterium ADurb.Bin341]|nr:MAG: hypothetical protein BWY57_01669 [Betaproteobacteria bacterium ADurb.Bin341]